MNYLFTSEQAIDQDGDVPNGDFTIIVHICTRVTSALQQLVNHARHVTDGEQAIIVHVAQDCRSLALQGNGDQGYTCISAIDAELRRVSTQLTRSIGDKHRAHIGSIALAHNPCREAGIALQREGVIVRHNVDMMTGVLGSGGISASAKRITPVRVTIWPAKAVNSSV